MRYIAVPPTIALTNLVGEALSDARGEPALVTFRQFAISRLTDLAFAHQGMAGTMAVVAIRDLLAHAEPGAVLALEDEHWRLLCQVTNKPTPNPGGLLDPYYAPIILHNMLPYMRAICEALDRAPARG